MKKTENYAMPYPEQDDYFNVEDFQDMMVSVDDLMKKLSDSGAQISSDAEHLYNQTKAQMDNIQKRMNAFTALRDGSTTGDAELEDIRVAYDGKEYGNAGEAVREQASDIHKALFGAGASIWSKAKSESTKYVAETKGICILNERFTAAGVVTKISRGTFAENESTLNLDRECSAYIVEFEKNPGTVYMPSAETIKIVSTTKIIFEANGNARCWIPVEKGQYLAVDSTATAYTYESNHVPYMLYDQANETLECRGFGSAGSIEPVDPYSLALEYKLEYDMDDTGLVKQIDANREDAALLKEIIDNVAFIGFQYLNSADGERNKYYAAYGNSKSVGDSNYVAFPIISLPAGKYYIQNLSDVFTFFDDGTSIKKFSGYNAENKTLVLNKSSKISVTGFGDVQTPMTISNVKVSDNKYGVVHVKIIGDNTSERIQTAENNIKSLDKKVESIINVEPSEKRHIITVGNEKDFASIKEAVASITDSSKNNIYDIYIDDGVYEEYAITLPDYVNLIGASGNREKCVIKGELPDSASANEITVNSTLNLKDSNVLENLTITAKNLRYPIHSESGGTHTNWVQILNNCYVEHFGNTSPNNTWTSYHAWGEGSSSGAYAEFNNCIFKSPAEPWYVHEFAYLPDIPRPYHHILNNCQIINTMVSDTGLWLSTAKIDNTKNSDIINTIDFNNCVFYNGEISINDVCSININIHGSNNVAIRVVNEYPNTDYTNIKTYVGTEPIKKGTVLKYGKGINLVEKANESTPAEMIAGVAVEDCESNTLVKIIKGTYVVASYRIGTSVYCDNDGQIADKGTYAIGTSYGEFSLIN